MTDALTTDPVSFEFRKLEDELAKGGHPTPVSLGVSVPQLTKRELFAAMAMQGWLAGCRNAYSEFTGPNTEMAAKASVTFADALLAALDGSQK